MIPIEVTILGSNSALPTSERNPSAQVLRVSERFFLLDCGEGTQLQLRRFHIPIHRINHIFISHLHGDHVFGLIGLISTFGLMNRKADLHLYAHAELEDLLTPQLNFFCQGLSFSIIYHPLSTGGVELILDDKHITVASFPLKHRIPSCGFLFREKQKLPNIRKEAIERYDLSIAEIVRIKNGERLFGFDGQEVPRHELVVEPPPARSYAYCTDTRFAITTSEYVKGVHTLYHEATFLSELKLLAKRSMHSTAADAAKVAKASGAQQLLIGHFSSRYPSVEGFQTEAEAIFVPTICVRDGSTYEIGACPPSGFTR